MYMIGEKIKKSAHIQKSLEVSNITSIDAFLHAIFVFTPKKYIPYAVAAKIHVRTHIKGSTLVPPRELVYKSQK